jgi:hypothetical protein
VLAERRLHRGWHERLSTLVLSAGVNAVFVVVLISLPRAI